MKKPLIKKTLAAMTVLGLITILVTGCGAGVTDAARTTTQSSGITGTSAAPLPLGKVAFYMTDAPPEEEITAVMVAVSGLRIHKAETEQEQEQSGTGNQTMEQEQEQEQQEGSGGEWIDIPISGNMTSFDLLQFRDVRGLFGTANVTVGRYTQVRLTVESAQVTTADGRTREAIVNSGSIKIVRPFTIAEGETTELLLDFDAGKSVIFTGGGKVLIKPVIKLSIDPGRREGPPEETGDDDDGADEEKPGGYAFRVSCDEYEEQDAFTGSITLPAGEVLTVKLCSNASTGYSWNEEAVTGDTGLLAQTGHEYVGPDGGNGQGQAGAAGTEEWSFQALAPGETTLFFTCGQPWEGGEKNARTLLLTVIIE